MLNDKRIWWTGGLVVALAVLVALALPTGSEAEGHEPPQANHFKCHQVLDWAEWEPRRVELKDQFGASVAHVIQPMMLCNPVDKNGEGIPNPEYHLTCYRIEDDPTGPTERVKEVMIRNQFQEGPLWVGMANVLCVPSQKSYQPRG
jgi:hypothetical protein